MKKHEHTAIYLALVSALVVGSTQVLAQTTGNTKYGTNALISVTPEVPWDGAGKYNSAFGEDALRANTSGYGNTASGALALKNNTTGFDNTASGVASLYNNSTGEQNTASGVYSLYANTSGVGNTANGFFSLKNNTSGFDNTASGHYSLHSNTTGSYNTAVGKTTLFANKTGTDNVAVGNSALQRNTASQNSALGSASMFNNTTGQYNSAVGGKSLYSSTTGSNNSVVGHSALYKTTTGTRNVAIGNSAGFNNVIGSGNVFLGTNAGNFETGSNKLYISNNSTTPLIYGVFSATGSANKLGIGTATVAASEAIKVWNGAKLTTGGVWTNASSRELKENIETLSTDDANKTLAALSPVRYVYSNSPDEEYVGFIAEDVPDLVASNDRKSLSPMDIVAVLTTVTKEQQAKLVQQEERILQLEMAMAELLRKQSSENQVGSRN